ncbi:hypothetical protein [Reyranella sp.]
MTDSAANHFAAIKARRLLGLLRAEWWAQPEDDFDLVLACALMRGGK